MDLVAQPPPAPRPRPVDDQTGRDSTCLSPGAGAPEQCPTPSFPPLDALYGCAQPHLNTKLAHGCNELAHQIGVKAFEGTCTLVDDVGRRAGTDSNVRELSGDVAAADEHDAPGQLFQV